MRLRGKITLCVLLALFALVSLTVVLGDLGVIPVGVTGEGYMLREYNGYIAVYELPASEYPDTVTDIPVRDLPLGDRRELAEGVLAPDRGAMMTLLEDYGA